jgi:hypothetical protein
MGIPKKLVPLATVNGKGHRFGSLKHNPKGVRQREFLREGRKVCSIITESMKGDDDSLWGLRGLMDDSLQGGRDDLFMS